MRISQFLADVDRGAYVNKVHDGDLSNHLREEARLQAKFKEDLLYHVEEMVLNKVTIEYSGEAIRRIALLRAEHGC